MLREILSTCYTLIRACPDIGHATEFVEYPSSISCELMRRRRGREKIKETRDCLLDHISTQQENLEVKER
jgi:hypothetical protein